MEPILIYEKEGRRVAGKCGGPTWAGGCPASAGGQPVACAGRTIRVVAGEATVELRVEPDAVTCPLAAVGTLLERLARSYVAESWPR